MTTLTEHEGSLFDSTAEGIGHGVNTHGLMGAGIAKEFKRRWPDMFEEYAWRCQVGKLTAGGCYAAPGFPVIFNIASQDRPGPHARLEWLISGTALAVRLARQAGIASIALPRIGCGIGGLDWADARAALVDVAALTEVDIEIWTPQNP